jgi:hypothetical protein
MQTLTLSREPLVTGCYASRSRWLRFAARHLNDQRPSGSTSWIFREHSDEMTGNILARQWHPRLGTSTDEAIRIPILIVALQTMSQPSESGMLFSIFIVSLQTKQLNRSISGLLSSFK